MDSEAATYYMSWAFADNLLREFVIRHGKDFQVARIVAIARGGLPVATVLAHQLGVMEIHSINAQSYRGSRVAAWSFTEDRVFTPLVDACNNPETLIVDDIADRGETMRYVARLLPSARRFALVAKSDGRPAVDYCPFIVPQKCWVHFPWEVLAEADA